MGLVMSWYVLVDEQGKPFDHYSFLTPKAAWRHRPEGTVEEHADPSGLYEAWKV
jgi:hypothetical protein